ncbi:MAG: HIT domain-containing protein [Alphaproteobacteria bacterium]
MFALDPQLEKDTLHVVRLRLCEVRLMNERAWPWLILVPMRDRLRELVELDQDDRHRLVDEIAHAERVLAAVHAPDKLNVAALGNQVAQLHVHVIARHANDPAWPRPVWGTTPKSAYRNGEAAAETRRLAAAFAMTRSPDD